MTKPKMMAFEDIRAGDQVQKPGAEKEWVTVVGIDGGFILWGDGRRAVRGEFTVEAGAQIPVQRASAG
jgi:hypothetical protein